MATPKTKHTPLAIFGSLAQLADAQVPHDVPIHAHQDFNFATQFLMAYQNNDATFRCFRREIERFAQWAWYVVKRSFTQLSAIDIEHYFLFCQSPPTHWVGKRNVPRFITQNNHVAQNPAWRPFVARPLSKQIGAHTKRYSMSEKGSREIYTVINCFYNYLLQNDSVSKNPVKLVKQKNRFFRRVQGNAKVRHIAPLQWDAVLKTAECMATDNPEKHERTLFVITLLYGLYLRVSELVAKETWEPTMNDFTQDHEENWWFKTVGKGNKEREIAVSNTVIKALIRWRKHLDCSTTLPLPADSQPLIPGRSPQQPIGTTRQIRRIVQTCFDKAVDQLQQEGLTQDAKALSQATVHWLRHTGISDDVKNTDHASLCVMMRGTAPV